MRTLLGTVVLLASATLPVVAAPAHAVDVCQNQPVTVTDDGSAGYLDGTEGDDVIVTHGRPVRALGGNDLVCGEGTAAVVDAGPGDDVVDMKHVSSSTTTSLGAGVDTFIGGEAADVVWAAAAGLDDVETDTISSGRANDTVVSGSALAANADRVATGPGDDIVDVVPTASGGLVALGPGANVLLLRLVSAAPRTWEVDTAEQVVRHGGGAMVWTGPSRYVVGSGPTQAAGSSVVVLGTGAGDRVVLDATSRPLRATVRLGGGDDVLTAEDRDPATSRYDLGAGRDRLDATGPSLTVDLAARGYAGIEDVRALGSVVRVLGTAKGNRLTVTGCDVRAVGRGGDDIVRREGTGPFSCTGDPDRLLGGPGDDRLIGSASTADVLVGGTGDDVADGRGGDDTCRAEVVRRCG